jgi:Polyketide cyclase / dehydrase and lipid transport
MSLSDQMMRSVAKSFMIDQFKARPVPAEIVTDSIDIPAPIEEVYQVFAQLEHWERALPDVLGLKILYEDDCHQEYLMTVERKGKPETVRGIRWLEPFLKIELFQPEPPPGFKRMCGIWLFSSDNGGTKVQAERMFNLVPDWQGRERTIAANLKGYLRANFLLFRSYIQDGLNQINQKSEFAER